MSYRNQHIEGRSSERGNENSNKSGIETCSWHEEFESYRGSISGLRPTDRCLFDSESGVTTFRGQVIQPSFIELMDLCFPYHMEASFGGAPTSDVERVMRIRDLVAKLNAKYAQRLKSVKVKDPRGPNSKREYVMVRAFLFNEFVSFDEQPRLHVLFSLAPTHVLEMVDELGESLQEFADERCPCCIPFMEVNRVSDQVSLLLRLVGIHKDRAFRQFPVVV
jgi:hypothetical protein